MEVVEKLKVWDQETIQSKLTLRGIEWNPPATSYQGGVSEEFYIPMIGEHLVNQLTLRKFLGELENILNDKSITPISTDPQDLEVLTPNQILLLRRNSCSSPEVSDESNRFKDRWKQVHLLTNEYWQRWTKEYLSTLLKRQKWL